MAFDEEKIFLRIQKGDRYALRELMDRYKNPFYAWAATRFTDLTREDFEDAFAEAILKFYEKAKKGTFLFSTEANSSPEEKKKTNNKIKPFLFKSAKNHLLNMLAKRYTHVKREKDVAAYLENIKRGDGDSNMAREDRIKMIEKALATLPETQRKVLVLWYFYDYNMDSIAQELGLANAAVAKATKYNAIKKIRKTIGNRYEVDDLL